MFEEDVLYVGCCLHYHWFILPNRSIKIFYANYFIIVVHLKMHKIICVVLFDFVLKVQSLMP